MPGESASAQIGHNVASDGNSGSIDIEVLVIIRDEFLHRRCGTGKCVCTAYPAGARTTSTSRLIG